MNSPLHVPHSIPDVFVDHHLPMMSFIAGRVVVGVCEHKA
jgi:hypothetical protein